MNAVTALKVVESVPGGRLTRKFTRTEPGLIEVTVIRFDLLKLHEGCLTARKRFT